MQFLKQKINEYKKEVNEQSEKEKEVKLQRKAIEEEQFRQQILK